LLKLYMANKLVVILGDYDTIQEALVKQGDIFAGRPQMYAFMPEKTRYHGVIFSEGDLWKEHRRFALSTLRDFGVGRPILESRIKEEATYLTEQFSEYSINGTAFDPQALTTCAVSNIVNHLIFGRRFSYDDKEFVYQFTALSKRASGGGVGFLSPFLLSETLSMLVQAVPMVKKLKKEADDFVDYTEREMKETMSAFDPEADPTNYVHAYMKVAKDRQGETFTEVQLLGTVIDIFMAGTETTATTLRWAFLLLAHHPEMQEKMYKEIREQIGTSVLPNYADKTKLPFAKAVIMEVQRMADLTPFGVPRRTKAPTKLMGYDIPEDTIIIPFLHNVLFNPDAFPNPEKFDPYRFLDSNGKVNRDPKLIPFQAGKRICLGEPLARMELFLFMVSLVSRFRFYFPNEQKKPTLNQVIGLSCTPHPYQICVENRSE